ncbi:MAG: tetratricopeptide repeat protein [Acidobacteria bacterium]|nr:tetratricopeptide repeat protein [Acidobacteriota bacterium]
MRTLFSVITILLFSYLVPAQSQLAKRAFDEATQSAATGNFDQALRQYRSAVVAADESSPDFDIKLRYNLGVCYYRTGKLKEAAKEFTTAIEFARGRHRRAYYALGMTEAALENWQSAKKAFLSAVALEPKDGEAWFDLAFVYLAEHDYDSAAAAFRRSIENRTVDSALAHNNLGVIMAMKFDLAAAEESFNTAIALSNGRLIAAKQISIFAGS